MSANAPVTPPPPSGGAPVFRATPGEAYRHYKGGLYRVVEVGMLVAADHPDVSFADGDGEDYVRLLHVGRWEEDLSPVVVYRFMGSVFFRVLRRNPLSVSSRDPVSAEGLTTPAVLYQERDDPCAQLWARREDVFFGSVEKDGSHEPRFTLAADDTPPPPSGGAAS